MDVLTFWWAMAGCSGPVDPDPVVDPEDDSCIEIVVDGGGGRLEHRGVTLALPAGAVEPEERVELCVQPSEDEARLSDLVTIGPASLVLASPAELAVPHTGDEETSRLWIGGAEAELRWAFGADRPEVGRLRGSVFRPGVAWVEASVRHQEPYRVPSAAVDVLFVLENSPRSEPSQLDLADSFPAYLAHLLDAEVDYHVGVTSTDVDGFTLNGGEGRLVEIDGARWIDPSTPDPDLLFARMAVLGELGSGIERGIPAAKAALDGSVVANEGFVRPDADLAVIVVGRGRSLARDHEPTDEEFIVWMNALKRHPARAVTHAVVGSKGGGYRTVASKTGGLSFDIDDDAWSDIVSALGADAATAEVRSNVIGSIDAATLEAWWLPADVEPERIGDERVAYDPETRIVEVTLGEAPIDEVILLYEVIGG